MKFKVGGRCGGRWKGGGASVNYDYTVFYHVKLTGRVKKPASLLPSDGGFYKLAVSHLALMFHVRFSHTRYTTNCSAGKN